MTNLLSILVLCGGQSAEHEISLLSARNVVSYLDKTKYNVSVALIQHDGVWVYYEDPSSFLSHSHSHSHSHLTLSPGSKTPFQVDNKPLFIDCVFPVLHGTNGEDGTVQGLLDILNIPYVGADCLASAIGMDKAILKKLLHADGLPVVPHLLFRKQERERIQYTDIKQALGATVFVKPNSLGSAVGINKAVDDVSFQEALNAAFEYDEFILVEKAISGREIECSVLGNERAEVSLPGEIIKHTEFYSYDAKYQDPDAATVRTPANLPSDVIETFRSLSLQAYKTLRTNGMARVDFFYANDGAIYLNEINTIPGFTDISMYPKNWEASGLPYAQLLDKLITLGFERATFKNTLNRKFNSKVRV